MFDQLEKKKQAVLEAMEYAVPEAERLVAEDIVDIYREDDIGLSLLLEFYSFLPEAKEDWIKEIRVVNRQRGIFLLAAITGKNQFLYLVSSEGIEFQGRLADGFLATELLDFFEYEDAQVFKTLCDAPQALPIYEPLGMDEDICPACHASSGEQHELGCPVELCPWCGGQLIHCDCRFEQMGLDALSTEEELDQFAALLEERGRIPYSSEQRPSFLAEHSDEYYEE